MDCTFNSPVPADADGSAIVKGGEEGGGENRTRGETESGRRRPSELRCAEYETKTGAVEGADTVVKKVV